MLRSVVAFCKLLLIINFLPFITCNSYFTVTAPGTIRSNRKYTVCATLHNVTEPAKLKIEIRDNSTWSVKQNVSLQPMETKLVEFFPPKLDLDKKYELNVESIQGAQFSRSKPLHIGQIEGVNIYIETDRGAYKPGDLVQFRVAILDEHARAVKIKEPIKVQIFDNLGNRIKQYKDIILYHGIYTNAFQLSKEPILGTWSLKVFIAGRYAQEKGVDFEVAKYVLPKFFVNIEADGSFIIPDRFMNITVFGQYTYNKLVDGNVVLTVKEKELIFITDIISYTADTVDFKAKFMLDLNDFSDEILSNRLIIHALLSEKQTGVSQSATTVIYLYHTPHNITVLHDEMEFKDGKPFRIKAKIQYRNHSVVNDPETTVFMTDMSSTFETKLNDNGVAIFESDDLPSGRTVTISYKNTSQSFYIPLLAGPQTSSNNCEMKIKNKSNQPNAPIDVLVEFIRDITYIVYILTSHGNIMKSEIVPIEANQKSYTISLFPTNEMVPVSFLSVHYIYHGYIRFCEIKIEVPENLDNQLSVSTAKEVKPGANISMTINAQPDSLIAITAVDLSSMLVNVGNRIKKSDILYQMRQDRTYIKTPYEIHPGTISGLLVISNVNYYPVRFITITSIPGSGQSDENYVRSYFPETWIFLDLNVTSAITTLNFTLPDTITTWVVTAFSINEKTGIGLLDSDIRITSVKPFFISTYLPYSIKQGEIASIVIAVFNYHSQSLETEVVMENPLNEFQFVDELSNMTINSATEKRHITVPANDGKSIKFLIKAQKLGHIDIIVEATSKLAKDKVIRKLLVEANGLETSHNHELYLNMQSEQSYTTRIKPNIPEDIEADTEFLQLSISGDVLLPSLDNIDNLVDKPTGCGEQNMIHFAPNILVLEYLCVTGQSSKYPQLLAKAQKYTEIGYQQQLKFRHSNGGYSVFGPKRSKTPSNWLTAYVVRFFIKALKYLSIETKIIDSSLKFLADTQLSNGEFANAGYLFNPSSQDSNGFTAFVLLSFLENPKYAKKYQNVIQKGLQFLSRNINQIENVYSLAIMSSVFQIANHEQASTILDKLKPLTKRKNGLQWWEDATDNRANDVEITSYILMALLNKPGHYLPIAKWLMEQRNSRGGFKSTQDTVVGLQAMIKFATLAASPNNTLVKVLYKALDGENKELENNSLYLDPDNMKILQHKELPISTRLLDIEIAGTGNIFLQFSYNYRKSWNLKHKPQKTQKSLTIKNKADLQAGGLTMNLEMCVQYNPADGGNYIKTNMIIAEVELPSGYIANEENIKELRLSEDVDRIEDDTPDKVIFYFTYIQANEEKCIELMADNKYDVRNLKPSKIIAYEYYHSDRREVVTYEIEKKENCENGQMRVLV